MFILRHDLYTIIASMAGLLAKPKRRQKPGRTDLHRICDPLPVGVCPLPGPLLPAFSAAAFSRAGYSPGLLWPHPVLLLDRHPDALPAAGTTCTVHPALPGPEYPAASISTVP